MTLEILSISRKLSSLLVLLLFVVTITLSSASVLGVELNVDGTVGDAYDCMDPAWKTVWLYKEGFRGNCPSGINCANIPISPFLNENWYRFLVDFQTAQYGDAFFVEVPDNGDGYYEPPIGFMAIVGRTRINFNLTGNHLGVKLPAGQTCADTDSDWINDVNDNCPLNQNSANRHPDSDGDGYGDMCDPDPQNPLVPDAQMQCGGTITQSKTLPHSLFCRNGDGLTISASNIVLDCAGWRLNGNGTNFGIKLANGVNGATIKNCQIRNFANGIVSQNIPQNRDNLIFNNFFSNFNNAIDFGYNNWNIPKTLGTNIIGGRFLGGNYWHDYHGADLNWDGIGDTFLPYNSNYEIRNLMGDSLPLVYPLLLVVPNIIKIEPPAPIITRFYSSDSNNVIQSNPNSTGCPNCASLLYKWGSTSQTTSDEIRTYIKFDLSSLPANAVIESATLRYYVANNLNDPRNFEIYSVADTSDAWQEASITWNNAPQPEPGPARASASFVPQQNTRYSIDLTSYVLEEYSSRNKIVTLVFTATPPPGTMNQWSIGTEEQAARLNKPTLFIKYR